MHCALHIWSSGAVEGTRRPGRKHSLRPPAGSPPLRKLKPPPSWDPASAGSGWCAPPCTVATEAGELGKPALPSAADRAASPHGPEGAELRGIRPPYAVPGYGGRPERRRPRPWPRRACFLFLSSRETCPRRLGPQLHLPSNSPVVCVHSWDPRHGPGSKVRGALAFTAVSLAFPLPEIVGNARLYRGRSGAQTCAPGDCLGRGFATVGKRLESSAQPALAWHLAEPGSGPAQQQRGNRLETMERAGSSGSVILWPREGRRVPG